MSEYKGVIFPLYTEMIERGLKEGKDVFAKYTNWTIDRGMTLYLYGSGRNGAKKIIAKGNIENSVSLMARKVWDEYGERLFQKKSEFEEYIEDREERHILVLELKDVRLLDNPTHLPEDKNMTVAGLFVDEELERKIEA